MQKLKYFFRIRIELGASMRQPGHIFFLCLTAWFALAQSALAWPKNEADIGAKNHPNFLAQQGGLIDDQSLSTYVSEIGNKIVAQTRFADRRWTFSVTDTPIVNAFATPGGYVYITRGLLALANSEAELAAVIGHEVAHLTAEHHSKRQKRGQDANIGVLVGTVLGGVLGGKDGLKKGIQLSSKVAAGYVGQFSQSQEFEADKLGTEYLARAGYDPLAQSSILNSLGRKSAFEAKKSGKTYNPNRVDFFATHPATTDRVRRARDFAQQINNSNSYAQNEGRYLAAIDGMIYGDSARQGFVRGSAFIHPEIGFRYTVPNGFVITNSARRVVSRGPNGATFNLDGGGKSDRSPANYIRQVWAPMIGKEVKIGQLGQIQSVPENGVNAATVVLPFQRNGETWLAHLTAIEHRGRFIRLTGTARQSDQGLLRDFSVAARSFQAISPAQASRYKPYRLRAYEVRPGDTVDWLSLASPSQQFRQELFQTLNGMPSNSGLRAGELVKVVTE